MPYLTLTFAYLNCSMMGFTNYRENILIFNLPCSAEQQLFYYYRYQRCQFQQHGKFLHDQKRVLYHSGNLQFYFLLQIILKIIQMIIQEFQIRKLNELGQVLKVQLIFQHFSSMRLKNEFFLRCFQLLSIQKPSEDTLQFESQRKPVQILQFYINNLPNLNHKFIIWSQIRYTHPSNNSINKLFQIPIFTQIFEKKSKINDHKIKQNHQFNYFIFSVLFYFLFYNIILYNIMDQLGKYSEQQNPEKQKRNSQVSKIPKISKNKSSCKNRARKASRKDQRKDSLETNCSFNLQQSCYQITDKLLEHTTITQPMMLKLKNWLLEETFRQTFRRQTYASACCYLDLYFQKGYTIQTQKFQNLGITCFILASKNIQSRMPQICFDVFNKNQLLELQTSIFFKLDFRLCPRTYISYLDELFCGWCIQNQVNKKQIRSCFEIADCLYLVVKTYSFQILQIIMNLFFIHILKSLKNLENPYTLSVEQFIKLFYDSKQLQIPLNLKQLLSKYHLKLLNSNAGVYIRRFYELISEEDAQRPQQESIRKQTYNKNSVKLVKKIISEFNK